MIDSRVPSTTDGGHTVAGRVVVTYSPMIDLRTSRLEGVEAVVRLQHTGRPPSEPDDFLPCVLTDAVGSGARFDEKLDAMTLVAIDTMLRDARAWRAIRPDLRVAIRVIPSRGQTSFVDDVLALVERHALPPDRLWILIAEQVLVHRARPDAVVDRLRSAGVRIAVDDVGAALLDTETLREIGADALKISTSWTRRLRRTVSDDRAVRSVIEMATALGVSVVAKGVDDAFQADALRFLGCTYAQGAHFGALADAAGIERMVRG